MQLGRAAWLTVVLAACAGPPAQPFRDVASPAGLHFENVFGGDRIVGSGLCWIDYDGDGHPDLFLAGDAVASRLYQNLGDGHFRDATAEAGLSDLKQAIGCAAADVDNDGHPDLYVLRAGPDRLYHNDGAGHFVDETAARGIDTVEGDVGTVAAFGDYDGDGWLDLFVGNYIGKSAPGGFPAQYHGGLNRLYHGIGGGRFAEVTDSPLRMDDPTLAAAFTDIDGDGNLDLWVVNDFGMFYQPNRLWRNDGGGHFTEVAAQLGLDARMFGMSAAPADVDRDGDINLYASDILDNALFMNEGGHFHDRARAAGVAAYGFADPGQGVPHYPPYDDLGSPMQAGMVRFIDDYGDRGSPLWGKTSWGAVFFDYDHDGALDLFVANGRVNAEELVPEGQRQPDMLFAGSGDGHFIDVSSGDVADRREARGVATADYDGDGDLDLAVGVGSLPEPGNIILLRNDVGAASGGWLAVRLQGTRSNRDGIGAKVRVTAGGVTQLGERFGGGSFASTSAPELHFGLGQAASAAVQVTWPSGLTDRYPAVPARTQLTAVEGTSP